jgi:antitoxin component of MazEF toxin-antitoxin module
MSTHTARITGDWLPLPEAVLRELDIQEGDPVQLEVVGDTILITRTAIPERLGPKPKK